jgi:hypothetical protein
VVARYQLQHCSIIINFTLPAQHCSPDDCCVSHSVDIPETRNSPSQPHLNTRFAAAVREQRGGLPRRASSRRRRGVHANLCSAAAHDVNAGIRSVVQASRYRCTQLALAGTHWEALSSSCLRSSNPLRQQIMCSVVLPGLQVGHFRLVAPSL